MKDQEKRELLAMNNDTQISIYIPEKLKAIIDKKANSVGIKKFNAYVKNALVDSI